MRNSTIFLLFILQFFIFSNTVAQQATIKVSSKTFNISKPENKDWNSISSGVKYFQIQDAAVFYSVNGTEHIIINPSDTIPTPPVHFIKKNNEWEFEGYYPEGAMDFFRNYVIVDSLGTIAIANHGNEIQNPWPHGDLFLVKTIGDSLKWTKVNNQKSFYHSLATGDINYDGLVDVIGVHQGTYTDWHTNIHPYIQTPEGNFIEDRQIIPDDYLGDSRAGGTALFVADIMGDSHVEIIQTTSNLTSWEYPELRFIILGYDENTKKYKLIYEQENTAGAFEKESGGTTSMQVADLNNDGLLDLVFALGGGVQIFVNDGNNNFAPKDFFIFTPDIMTKGEPVVVDVDNDGWKDIVLQPYGWGNLNKINQYQNSRGMYGTGFKLNYYIWKNNQGTFEFSYAKENLKVDNMFVGTFRANMNKGVLKFVAFGHEPGKPENGIVEYNSLPPTLYEIEFHFCNNMQKPIFELESTQFCDNDSMTVKITNAYQGDKYVWEFGDLKDTTESSIKVFYEEGNVHVTRIDSFGCTVNSDSLQLFMNSSPEKPVIYIEDDALKTVSGLSLYEWYKDDSLVVGANSNIFESPNYGEYKVRITNQNGCSSESNSIIYTPVGVDELKEINNFKIYPNPITSNILTIEVLNDFPLNIDIFDIDGKLLLKSKINQVITQLNVDFLSKGTYFIHLSYNNQSIGTQKLVK